VIIEVPVCELNNGDILVVSSPASPMITATFLWCIEPPWPSDEVMIVTEELEHPIWMDWDEPFPVWLGVEVSPWSPGPI
jgi:hypothetical protein